LLVVQNFVSRQVLPLFHNMWPTFVMPSIGGIETDAKPRLQRNPQFFAQNVLKLFVDPPTPQHALCKV
jgi:hypothetical protein